MRIFYDDFEPGPIANNSLIVSGIEGLRLECISNLSWAEQVGIITDNHGFEYFIGDNHGFLWRVVNPSRRPGVLRLQTRFGSSMTASDQGIYTCTIPDSDNNTFVFNVGLYPNGFNGK